MRGVWRRRELRLCRRPRRAAHVGVLCRRGHADGRVQAGALVWRYARATSTRQPQSQKEEEKQQRKQLRKQLWKPPLDRCVALTSTLLVSAVSGLDLDALLHLLLHRSHLASKIPNLGPCPSYAPTLRTTSALRAVRHASCTLELNDDPKVAAHVDVPTVGPPFALAAASPRAPPRPSATADADAEPTPSVRVHLGSLGHLPPLLLFAPCVAATLQRALGFSGPPVTNPSASTAHDHTDIWDDDFSNGRPPPEASATRRVARAAVAQA